MKEHGFDTEGGGKEGGSIRGVMVKRAVSILRAVVERTVVEPGNEALCFYASICSQ